MSRRPARTKTFNSSALGSPIGLQGHSLLQRDLIRQRLMDPPPFIPTVSRLAAAAAKAYCGSWKMEGYTHLASLAIVRRDAFVSSQWDLPGQQVSQPIYLPGSKYNSIQALADGAKSGDCGTIATADFINGLPRDQFDYVWILKADVPRDIAPWLVSIYRGSFGHLYAIRPRSPQTSSVNGPSHANQPMSEKPNHLSLGTLCLLQLAARRLR